eukprot:CAMPEP_0116085036 /NCGR_PEP_ID=MMETSP0327-20121206/4113_1 /TAXON_ID=44447 /ORGANISM="Pseudo-nitzschia delicatissima, Strain B596" /LENGTH=522 /DNA_ID=CAMNT_0003576005 /DNA_START=28 /DNA_END=1596 /DNA_ORIENTATION=+
MAIKFKVDEIFKATVTKTRPGQEVGLYLEERNRRIYVTQIEGIFKSSGVPVEVGDQLLEVNGAGVTNQEEFPNGLQDIQRFLKGEWNIYVKIKKGACNNTKDERDDTGPTVTSTSTTTTTFIECRNHFEHSIHTVDTCGSTSSQPQHVEQAQNIEQPQNVEKPQNTVSDSEDSTVVNSDEETGTLPLMTNSDEDTGTLPLMSEPSSEPPKKARSKSRRRSKSTDSSKSRRRSKSTDSSKSTSSSKSRRRRRSKSPHSSKSRSRSKSAHSRKSERKSRPKRKPTKDDSDSVYTETTRALSEDDHTPLRTDRTVSLYQNEPGRPLSPLTPYKPTSETTIRSVKGNKREITVEMANGKSISVTPQQLLQVVSEQTLDLVSAPDLRNPKKKKSKDKDKANKVCSSERELRQNLVRTPRRKSLPNFLVDNEDPDEDSWFKSKNSMDSSTHECMTNLIDPGDLMKISGFTSQPDMNGLTVEVVRRSKGSKGKRWDVRAITKTTKVEIQTHFNPKRLISVSSNNLKHFV